MKENEKVTKLLREKGRELEIPEGLQPKRMREKIERYEEHNRKTRSFPNRRYLVPASAACICLIAGVLFIALQMSRASDPKGPVQAEKGRPTVNAQKEAAIEEQEVLKLPESSYEEIYACLSENWKKNGGARMEAITGETEELAMADSASMMQKMEAFGRTNTRTEQIDEADQIKNDGRYLYQIASKASEDASGSLGIQILDTEGGLHETAFLDGFTNVEEFYVWEDLLITIENKYYDSDNVFAPAEQKKQSIEDLAVCGLLYEKQGYHEISFYQISDRSCPKKQKTFTLQGFYESSRIAEGYFYEIGRFTAGPGEGAQDYDAYIPSVDGNKIEASRIYCPPDADGTDYLVFVSVNLSDPSSLTDSRAVVAGSGTYYMSTDNLYVAWYQPFYQRKPDITKKVQDVTKLLRFRYWKGRFYAQAEGEVPGYVESSFSIDEYEGDLRIALTVQTSQAEEIIDDRTNEHLGFDYGEITQTNALYILGPFLDIKGKIEGLAEDETIRSVRFLGDVGYFVTFRQTDPLFAADLSDPEHPRILGELKVSGFSEYLHFYGEELMFGIGMEADEETGQEQGIKLSMFDLADPADLKEVSRLSLTDYTYSEALRDHRALLIDPAENIIGFSAEGNGHDTYFLFSYEEGVFVQKLKVEAEGERFLRTRGTFIKDTFYLLRSNGSAQSYDRNTGVLLETMEP